MHESAVISNLGRTGIHGRNGGDVSGVAGEIQSREWRSRFRGGGRSGRNRRRKFHLMRRAR